MGTKTFQIVLKSMHKGQAEDVAYVSEGKSLLIGRASQHSTVDFKLYNDFVSREHCRIYMNGGKLHIEDLGSKHGTAVNEIELVPNEPSEIAPGDRITLIHGLIELYICIDNDLTREFTSMNVDIPPTIAINEYLQTLIIGEEPIKLSAKEFTCLKLLYENMDNLILKEEIVENVWPERVGEPDQLVTAEEVASLLYRVRKRVKGYFTIKAVAQKGYYMESIKN
ncbi:FHA domain-containing protein [Cytobacillus praedii]|uniref:FHA domain-containing protein n=1 Tax=Cytobacillus praedii TaxID=1742358 RepID=UPI002E219493|nr:FHA domain-containing protein [Cytobacillus praedii]MED3548994.1 FHA domain-containing protein [Cytobacillus praedii]